MNATTTFGADASKLQDLLMTRMGEVPYDRYRGFDQTLYELPIQEMNEALVPELDRLMMWEPDAEVVEAEARIDENGECLITMTVEINLEES
ncbi:MAG: hypothetical protein ACLUI3_00200 [Christensenellales bacterium]